MNEQHTPCSRCGSFAQLYTVGDAILCQACIERTRHPILRTGSETGDLLEGTSMLLKEIGAKSWTMLFVCTMPIYAVTRIQRAFMVQEHGAMLTFTDLASAYNIPYAIMSVLVAIAYCVVFPIVALGPTLVARAHLQGESITLFEIARILYRRYFGIFGVLLAMAVGLSMAWILCLFPALIVGAQIFLAPILLIAEERSVIDSLRESGKLTKGRRLNSVLAFCVFLIVAIVAFLPITGLTFFEISIAGGHPNLARLIPIELLIGFANAAVGAMAYTAHQFLCYVIYAKARRDTPLVARAG